MKDFKELLKETTFRKDFNEVVKAEDLEIESSGKSIDWDGIFFEPEPGSSYVLKFLPNLDPQNQNNVVHRTFYKLPNFNQKGKTFTVISKGRGCPVLELFWEMNALSKEGDAVAKAKIDKYLTNKKQACVKIQILSSPNKDEIGIVRLLRFQSFGDNATIANLLNSKLNPPKEVLENDPDAKEDIFDIFESSTLSLVCKEATYEGVKGRSFSSSSWLTKKRGAFVRLESGEMHEFSKADLIDNDFKPEVGPFLDELIKQITGDNCSIYRWFEYKDINDPRNTEDMKEYLTELNKRTIETVNLIRTKSLQELESLKIATTPTNDTKKVDIIQESVPDELKDLVDSKQQSQTTNDEIDSLL